MAASTDFIARSAAEFSGISFVDRIKSTFLIFFSIGFILFFIGGMIGLAAPVKGSAWGIMMLIVFGLIIGSWLKLFQCYEKKTSIKKKIFMYRLSQAMSVLGPGLSVLNYNQQSVKASYALDGRTLDLTLTYDQNLLRNIGGIVPGTPVGGLKKVPHSKTWYLLIKGQTSRFSDQQVAYDFSARKDETEAFQTYGVRVYDLTTKKK
jgi:hypothetical protein